MSNTFRFSYAFLLFTAFTLSSCFSDLDVTPPDTGNLSSEDVYSNPDNYINVLAKIYAGLATTGNTGPAGNGDIGGIDEGFSSYLRILFNLQVVTTDEAVLGWSDPGVPELNFMEITSTNSWIVGMYYRIFFQIALCNEFLRETTQEKLSDRGFDATAIGTIRGYANEVRFLRALSYYHALDLFGNVPFVDETILPGASALDELPTQINRADLFAWIEAELLAVESELPAPMANLYARVDQAAAWMTLARLYLNAEVYASQDRYADCIASVNKVINAGYMLDSEYQNLFLRDNHLSPEFIHAVSFDGKFTQTWGGTTYLVHAPVGGTMDPLEFGVNGGWAGLRSTPQLVGQFDGDSINDSRYMFYKDGQQKEITTLSTFEHGYAVAKWRNVDQAGGLGSDNTGNHVDNDFPVYRLGDAYLMYAEAVLRGGGGDVGTAVGYINQLRERAFGGTMGNITASDMDLAFLLDERSREMYWESTRRTDLIRYGLFTGGDYLWAFKGGSATGASLDDFKKLYPIPDQDIIANPNLQQNPGY